MPRDKAGVGHSIGGPGVSAIAQTQPKDLADSLLAKDIVEGLSEARLGKRFDRMILIAGPHTMGLRRANLDAPLSGELIGGIPQRPVSSTACRC